MTKKGGDPSASPQGDKKRRGQVKKGQVKNVWQEKKDR
jgi:hypothetical protein